MKSVKLASTRGRSGIDFVIILTPYVAAAATTPSIDILKLRVRARRHRHRAVQHPQTYYPIIDEAREAARDDSEHLRLQAGRSGKPAADHRLREAVGKELEVSVADETPLLYNVAVMGDDWLLNYCPHLYQVPGYLPVNDYTEAVRRGRHEQGGRDCAERQSASRRACEVDHRATAAQPAACRSHEQKVWMEVLGMVGGPVRTPCSPMSDAAREALRADLEASGLLAKLRQHAQPEPLRQAV